MKRPTRESIFKDASRKMRTDFEDARNNLPHRGQAGGEGEEIIRSFLNDHLPGRFRTTDGFIIDKKNEMTGHIDVIIYDVFNCPVYRTSKHGMIIPNDNVASAFEVKFNLTTTSLDSALDKVNETKNLYKTPLTEYHPPAEFFTTYGVIFAFESKLNYNSVFKRLKKNLTERNPLHNSCSMVVILDKGIFITCTEVPGFGAAACNFQQISICPVGTKFGYAFFEFGENTLDFMMRHLLSHLTFFRHRIDHPGFELGPFSNAPIVWVGQQVEDNKIVYLHK